MSLETTNDLTFHLIARNESFELSLILYRQFVQSSINFDSSVHVSNNERQISLDVDPCIFNVYLLYIQSGCFVRPDSLSQEDLIDGLRICGAPTSLINHYEQNNLISSPFSSHRLPSKEQKLQRILLDIFLLFQLIIGTCILPMDLYRQILMFNGNSLEYISKTFVVIVYCIDSALFLYSTVHATSTFFVNIREGKQSYKDLNIFIDIISCFGVISYFTAQRPISNICLFKSNFLWISVHISRTLRVVQLGYHLINIKLCLSAIFQCLWRFLQTLIGLFWIFIFSGSILYLFDIIENNEQYSSIYSTILSAHETLYTIGYRNNAPYGHLTRLWTILSIFFLSSLVQILCWQFQRQVIMKIRTIR
ncbi:unnamed protein product [Adineta ricciae]|uniref:Uncharacterized protein n=1 Tax=Adineta ricciae TaxID=249248 RepID=A0A816EI16_ADIRI|nr:unnamed protein product [Adineta ricciae]CAF1649963.1 unnamed protein product [Adineta ricciae]